MEQKHKETEMILWYCDEIAGIFYVWCLQAQASWSLLYIAAPPIMFVEIKHFFFNYIKYWAIKERYLTREWWLGQAFNTAKYCNKYAWSWNSSTTCHMSHSVLAFNRRLFHRNRLMDLANFEIYRGPADYNRRFGRTSRKGGIIVSMHRMIIL